MRTGSVDVTLSLRRAPPRATSLELLTLGPKQPGFFPFRTVPLAAASQTVTIPAVGFKENGVVAACIDATGGNSSSRPMPERRLSSGAVVASPNALLSPFSLSVSVSLSLSLS
eukprot:COSAG04_NODE_3351_length_2903_cov_1.161198_1_plen_112_part_10